MNNKDLDTLKHIGTLLHQLVDEIRELQQHKQNAEYWETIADGLANTHPQHDWQDSRILYQIAKENKNK